MILRTKEQVIKELVDAFMEILGDRSIPYTEEGRREFFRIIDEAVDKCYPDGHVMINCEE